MAFFYIIHIAKSAFCTEQAVCQLPLYSVTVEMTAGLATSLNRLIIVRKREKNEPTTTRPGAGTSNLTQHLIPKQNEHSASFLCGL